MTRRLLAVFAAFFVVFGVLVALAAVLLYRSYSDNGTSATSASLPASRQAFYSATVKRVVDGDTIELLDGTRVRYLGMNTPETVAPNKPIECMGPDSSARNKQLVATRMLAGEMGHTLPLIDVFRRIIDFKAELDVPEAGRPAGLRQRLRRGVTAALRAEGNDGRGPILSAV